MMSCQMPGNPMPGNPMPPAAGYGPNQPGGYQAEPFYGPESAYGPGPGARPYQASYYELHNETPDQEIADVVLGLAGRFIGKAIKNKMQKVVEQRVTPTINAQAEQKRQEWAAIAQQHPDLRACMRDQVVFLAGGTRVVPLSEVPNITTITPAQADAVVARLREP